MIDKFQQYYLVDGDIVVVKNRRLRVYEGEPTSEWCLHMLEGRSEMAQGRWEYEDCRTLKNEEGKTVTFND